MTQGDRTSQAEKKRRAHVRHYLRLAAGASAGGSGDLPGRGELLTGILLVALLVGVPLTVLPLIVLPGAYVYLASSRLLYALLIVTVVVALGLNYSGRTRAATWVLMLGTLTAMLAAAVVRPPTAGRELVYFLFVPLVLGSVLLSPRDAKMLLLLNALGIIFYGLLPGSDFGGLVLGPLVFQLFIFGLISLMFWYQRQEELAIRTHLKQEDIVYQTLLERAYDGVGLLHEGQVAEASPGFGALFGQAAEGMVGRRLADFLSPAAGALVARLRETVTGEPIEISALDADGHERHLELVAQPVMRGGQPAQLVAVRDVSERVTAFRVAEQLRQFSSGLRQAPNRTAMPAVITRLLLDVADVRAAVLLTPGPDGYALQAEARSGGNLGDADLDPNEARHLLDRSETVWRPGNMPPQHLGLLPLHVDDTGIGVLAVLTSHPPAPVTRRTLAEIAVMIARALQRATAHQATRSYAAVLEERVAERTRELTTANQRLQELDRLKSKFVSDVSHELRTPVTSIKLYLDLLAQGSAARREAYMLVLRQQVERLQDLLEDILDLSRLDLKRDTIPLTKLDLAEVVKGVVTDYADRAAAGELTLRYRPVADLPPARGHQQLLAQVVGHLLSNAITYTASGCIEVTLGQEETSLVLTVADTGPGISSEDLPHVFERFYRGTLAAQSTIPGSGLGLALVREIIDIHGGTVAIETAAEQGTTVRVRLPLDSPPQAVPEGAADG